ncbi:MAG: hypothetical protein LC687_03165 [Actinobacteria bacterium]|nr:hypothetical protein [Actinomycetota bacterium]
MTNEQVFVTSVASLAVMGVVYTKNILRVRKETAKLEAKIIDREIAEELDAIQHAESIMRDRIERGEYDRGQLGVMLNDFHFARVTYNF